MGGRDVGVFKRRIKGTKLAVDVWLASGARAGDAEGAGTAADRLGQHLGLDALTTVHVGP